MNAPGFTPTGRPFKDLIKRMVGAPSLLKRLQWNDIFSALDLKPDHVVLDFGCSATGYMTFDIARKVKKAVGIDISPVDKLYVPDNLKDKLSFFKSKGEELPFEDNTFDVILMSEVLPMIPDPEPFIKEAARVLKSNGRVILVNPVERKGLKEEFANSSGIVALMNYFGRAPASYDAYTTKLQESFGTSWKSLKGESYYRDLLMKFGFSVDRVIFSPSQLCQDLFEKWQFVDLCFGRKTIGSKYFYAYPLFKVLDFIKSNPRGTGCIMVGSLQE